MFAQFESAMPVLSRGRHRNLTKGACFMEFASYLAGERWSDHPPCTHPLVALVAREVNDRSSDTARSALAPLIPSVIGLTGDDPHIAPAVTAACVRLALPVVSHQHQNVLAVALLGAERVLAELDGRPVGDLRPESRAVLDRVPSAHRWAIAFVASRQQARRPDYAKRSAPRAASYAVRCLAEAVVPDRDAELRRLLVAAIEEFRVWSPAPAEAPVAPAEAPVAAGGAWEAAASSPGAMRSRGSGPPLHRRPAFWALAGGNSAGTTARGPAGPKP